MNFRKATSKLATATLALMFCTAIVAQGPTDTTVAGRDTSAAAMAPATPEPAPSAGSQEAQYPTGSSGGDWRVGVSFYGYFPGVHGTVGALGHNAGIHSSFSDVFHVLKGVIPIAVEANKGRFVMPVDFLWIKLGIDSAIPLNDAGQTSINTHMTQSILTPKVGFRLHDGEKMKLDALAGIRYWYASVNNELVPSGLSKTGSANWVDGLGGARFIFPFGEKAAMTLAGDASAGQSNLDYQAVGLLNFNFTRHVGMGIGWRYLYEDFRPTTNELVYNPTMTGPLAGLTFNTGGKPPVAPTLSCAASPAQVYPGDPITVTASAAGLDPKLNALYSWSDGVSGSGTTATVNTSASKPGTYTVRGDVKEGKPSQRTPAGTREEAAGSTEEVTAHSPPERACRGPLR